MTRLLNIAYKATRLSTHPFHQMAAVVARGGSILAVEPNLERLGAHCERRALRPHLNLAGATIVVVRANRGVSRPCPRCMAAIRAAGIKKVVYVDFDGEVQVERL
jgi:deoxycytidylate deaminase